MLDVGQDQSGYEMSYAHNEVIYIYIYRQLKPIM